MRKIQSDRIIEITAKLCKQANCYLPEDVHRALKDAYKKEESETGRWIFTQILENARIAGEDKIALCQDTGLVEVFIKMGLEVEIEGSSLEEAINSGVALGYKEGYLRNSVVNDPIERKNTGNNTPCRIYVDRVPGKELEITVLPKGAGSENSSVLNMLVPSSGWFGVKEFIIETVKTKGAGACPPLVVGVGLGGNFSSVALLAKKAILRDVGVRSKDPYYAKCEIELLQDINKTGIGPMGLGGTTTALDVHIEYAPCHIASLPVAVSMQCHSCRRMTEVI